MFNEAFGEFFIFNRFLNNTVDHFQTEFIRNEIFLRRENFTSLSRIAENLLLGFWLLKGVILLSHQSMIA